ncbi:MAG: hypothetical protein IJ711_07040 [Lachnospiraceae bacterium]|nr:hypothetical protein [Lachnospiraceae bacterium]
MDFQSNINEVTDFTREKIEAIKKAVDTLNEDRRRKIFLCHAVGAVALPVLLFGAFFLGRLVQKKKEQRKRRRQEARESAKTED